MTTEPQVTVGLVGSGALLGGSTLAALAAEYATAYVNGTAAPSGMHGAQELISALALQAQADEEWGDDSPQIVLDWKRFVIHFRKTEGFEPHPRDKRAKDLFKYFQAGAPHFDRQTLELLRLRAENQRLRIRFRPLRPTSKMSHEAERNTMNNTHDQNTSDASSAASGHVSSGPSLGSEFPMNNQPKSMHCDWGMMRDETNWDKTEGVAELRGRLDKIREGFEAAVEAPPTFEQKLAELREASAAQKAERETEFAAIDEAIATHCAVMPVDLDHGPVGNHEAEMAYEIRLLRAENERLKIKLSRMCCDA